MSRLSFGLVLLVGILAGGLGVSLIDRGPAPLSDADGRGIIGEMIAADKAGAAPPAELDPAERALVMRLADWPVAVAEAEERRAPHRVAAYLIELARDFHAFYHRCRVVGEAPEVEAFRLDLCRATGQTVRIGLDLLGVEAPERM